MATEKPTNTISSELDQQIQPVEKDAKSLTISTIEDLEKAVLFCQQSLSLVDQVDETLGKNIKQAHKTHKDLKDSVDKIKAPLLSATEIVKDKMKAYLKKDAPEELPKIKGFSCSEKEVIEVPDLNNEQFIELMKLASKGKIPPGLFKLDAKVYGELYNLGMFNTLGETAKPKTTKVKTITIRRK